MNLDYYTDTKVDGSQEDKCCQVKGEFVCQRNGSLRTTSGPAPHRCQDAPLTALPWKLCLVARPWRVRGSDLPAGLGPSSKDHEEPLISVSGWPRLPGEPR